MDEDSGSELEGLELTKRAKAKKYNEDREALIAVLAQLTSLAQPQSSIDYLFDGDTLISQLQNKGTLLEHLQALKELKTEEEKLLPHAQVEKRKLDEVSADVINAVLQTAERKFPVNARDNSTVSYASVQRHSLMPAPSNNPEQDKDTKETPVRLFKAGLLFIGAAGVVSYVAVSTGLYPLFALAGLCAVIGGALMLTACGMNQEKTSLWDQAFPQEKSYDHNFYPAAFA